MDYVSNKIKKNRNSEVFYFSILFIVMKFVLFEVSNSTKENVLKPFLKLYNLGMVIFSAGCFIAMLKALQEITLYGSDCSSAFDNKLFALTAKLFYYSKFVEYIDSWSLALSGKRVSVLQFIHHLGAPWDMYLFFVTKNEGIWIFVLLNSFVHTVMYSYYLASLYKIRIPFKSCITYMQITQFNVGFYLVWFYKDVACYSASAERLFGWLFNYLYVGAVLVLFINFTIWTYFFPSRRGPVKTKAE